MQMSRNDLQSIKLGPLQYPSPYATIVLAVALSYLHVGGKTPTVL